MEVVISAKLPDNILAHSSHFRRWDLSRHGGHGGTWWWKEGTSKKQRKAMASYPWELAQDAEYQSHNSRLTELWSPPRPAQGLNTNNNNNQRVERVLPYYGPSLILFLWAWQPYCI